MRSTASIDAFLQAPFAMALVAADEPFSLIVANAAFADYVGQRDGRLAGMPLERLLASADLSPRVVDTLRGVASDRVPRSEVEATGFPRRWWETTVSYVEHARAPSLLYAARDVTEREQQRRRLQESRTRLAALTAFARSSLSVDVDGLLAAAASAAGNVSYGPAAVYLGDAAGPLRRAGTSSGPESTGPALPDVLPAARFSLVRNALEAGGSTRLIRYRVRLAIDERDLLRRRGMAWLAAIPIRGQRSTLGLVVAMSRDPRGVLPEQLQVLEACASQLALAIEHANLFREIETERAGLALVLEQIPDAVLIADLDGRVAHANPAAGRLLGIATGTRVPVDAAGASVVENSSGAFGDLGIGRALAGEIVRGVLGVVRGDTAEPTWIMSSAAPLVTPSGARTGAVAVASDITRHRRAEEALRVLAETSAALVESLDYRGTMPVVAEILVPRVADICTIDIVTNDVSTRIAHAAVEATAPHLVRALGHASTACRVAADGRPQVVADVRDADLRALTDDPAQVALLRELGIRSSMSIPIGARGSVYGTLWLATTVSGSGRRYGGEAQVLAEDVARRIGNAIDNARLFQDAQEADRRKDEFLAMLSHELRTPLAPVMAWMQILKRAPDPERVRAAIEVIERNVRLQATLIDDLLDLTAITRGKVTLDRAPHDLRAIVETAVETVRVQVTEKGIVLACELSDEPVVVDGDANRLQQVVWNLLANAVKFSPQGERILVRVAREGDTATLRVRDRGSGIAPEFLPHVFDMFQQQERGDRRRYGGLGIGLAIARRVTELHRGTIDVASEGLGHGAEFCVRLPLTSETVEQRNGSPTSTVLEGRTVLLVEDVPDTREAARVMLEQMGVRVVDAAQGEEALIKLDEGVVDVVLCDLRMPLMDGFELIRRIRENPHHRTLPVIAVSGYATHDDEERTRRAGFDGYVRKPFVESALLAAVERVMHERQRST